MIKHLVTSCLLLQMLVLTEIISEQMNMLLRLKEDFVLTFSIDFYKETVSNGSEFSLNGQKKWKGRK
jgi:hypothetical protein